MAEFESSKSEAMREKTKIRHTDFFVRMYRLGQIFFLLIFFTLCSLFWLFFNPPRPIILPDGNTQETFISQYTSPYIKKISNYLGFRLSSILLSGNYYLTNETIVTALKLNPDILLPFIAPKELRQNLEQLDWVQSALIKRQFPHTLTIHITERQPLALLTHSNQIVTADGKLLYFSNLNNRPELNNLSLIKGQLAEQHVLNLYQQLSLVPEILSYLVSAEYIGARRWDIFLKRPIGFDAEPIKIQLPEQVTDQTINQLRDLILNDKLLELKIERVDLRIPNKAIFTLTKPSNKSK